MKDMRNCFKSPYHSQKGKEWVSNLDSLLLKAKWAISQLYNGENKLQYSQRHTMINHCDRRITLLSGTDIFYAVLNLFTYFLVHFGW